MLLLNDEGQTAEEKVPVLELEGKTLLTETRGDERNEAEEVKEAEIRKEEILLDAFWNVGDGG